MIHAPLEQNLAYISSSVVCGYLAVGFSVWVIYDQVITFDNEVARIWTLCWRWPKILFLVNRYVVGPMLFMNGIVMATFPLDSFCDFMSYWQPWVAIISLATVELILIVRVSAIYGHSKNISRFLKILFACEMIAVLVNTSILIKGTHSILLPPLMPGCFSTAPSGAFSFWLPFVVFEGIIIILTLYQVFPSRTNLNPTLRLLARDSIVYFVVMLTFQLLAILWLRFSYILEGMSMNPANCIACVTVSRMMLNIRGLAVDDPNCTGATQLQNISFPSSLSEDEEGGG